MQFAARCRYSEATSREKEEQTDGGPPKSFITEHAQMRGVMTSSAVGSGVTVTTDACLPPGVASSADDDERSLDENLRPMDGQIWLPDVDGGISDTFQTTVNTLCTKKRPPFYFSNNSVTN